MTVIWQDDRTGWSLLAPTGLGVFWLTYSGRPQRVVTVCIGSLKTVVCEAARDVRPATPTAVPISLLGEVGSHDT